MFQYRTILFVLYVHFTTTFATIQPLFKGCSVVNVPKLSTAIQDAIDVATEVHSKLLTYDFDQRQPEWIDGAFRPLFQKTDIPQLLALFDRVSNIRTSTEIDIRFYCTEDHIMLHNNKWTDQDYSYINTQGQRMPASIYINADPSVKPGVKGSYTTAGLKPKPDIDFSSQYHIFIHPDKFKPSLTADGRPYNEVRAFGLKEGLNTLDAVRPLMETVFHELIHAVGGTVASDNNQLNIGDGPSKDTYGWVKCTDLNTAAIPIGRTIDVADCISILAKALYLQIYKPGEPGKNTYWSTGIVDIDTLDPLDVPLAPRSRDAEYNGKSRRSIDRFGRSL